MLRRIYYASEVAVADRRELASEVVKASGLADEVLGSGIRGYEADSGVALLSCMFLWI